MQCWEIKAESLSTLLSLEPELGFKFFSSLAFEMSWRYVQHAGFIDVDDDGDGGPGSRGGSRIGSAESHSASAGSSSGSSSGGSALSRLPVPPEASSQRGAPSPRLMVSPRDSGKKRDRAGTGDAITERINGQVPLKVGFRYRVLISSFLTK